MKGRLSPWNVRHERQIKPRFGRPQSKFVQGLALTFCVTGPGPGPGARNSVFFLPAPPRQNSFERSKRKSPVPPNPNPSPATPSLRRRRRMGGKMEQSISSLCASLSSVLDHADSSSRNLADAVSRRPIHLGNHHAHLPYFPYPYPGIQRSYSRRRVPQSRRPPRSCRSWTGWWKRRTRTSRTSTPWPSVPSPSRSSSATAGRRSTSTRATPTPSSPASPPSATSHPVTALTPFDFTSFPKLCTSACTSAAFGSRFKNRCWCAHAEVEPEVDTEVQDGDIGKLGDPASFSSVLRSSKGRFRDEEDPLYPSLWFHLLGKL